MDFSSASAWDDSDVWGSTGPSSSPKATKQLDKSPGEADALDAGGLIKPLSGTSLGWPDAASPNGFGNFGSPGNVSQAARSPPLATPKPTAVPTMPPVLLTDFDDDEDGAAPSDDFDEAPVASGSGQAEADDGFDDFGDFDEGGTGDDDDFGGFDDVPPPLPSAGLSIDYGSADRLRPLVIPRRPRADDISPHLGPLIESAFPASASAAATPSQLSDDPERQVEGLAQVLVTEELRGIWKTMVGDGQRASTSSGDGQLPVEWRRSRIRRDFLVSLGVPVDLNDFLKPAQPLAKLSLSLDTSTGHHKGPSSAPARAGSVPLSRPGSAAPGASASPGLGREPLLDRERCRQILEMSEGHLTLQTPQQLRKLQDELVELTTATSELLTHKLHVREQHAADGETYNAMISDLISAASKIKTSSSSGITRAPSNTGSTRWSNRASVTPPAGNRPLPGGGSATPPRVASPASMYGRAGQTNGGRPITGSGAMGAAGDPRRFSSVR